MELTYQVPRDAYVNLLESMIRKNDRRPLKMLTALLLTVGQMTAVILLCIFKLEGSQRIFVLIWSVLVAGLLFAYQQKLIAKRERDACFKAFMNNNYVGLVLFLGLAMSYFL